MKPHLLALVIGALLCTGLALIAHGTGALTGKWSVGLVVLGVAMIWVGLKFTDHTGGKYL